MNEINYNADDNGEQQIREEEQQQQQEVVAKADIITPASKQLPATFDSGAVFDINPSEFSAALERRRENREQMTKWIGKHLIEGTDFHKLKGKEFLGKSGAEKILSLLGCVARYPNLEEYEKMMIEGKSIPATIIIRCEVWRGASVLSEGIGARTLEQDREIIYEKNDKGYADKSKPPRKGELNINKSLKMAKKSANLDAVLGLGLSEIFSQDYEEVQQSINNAPPPPPPPAKKPASSLPGTKSPPSDNPKPSTAKTKTADGTKLGAEGLLMVKEIQDAVKGNLYQLRPHDTFFEGEKGFFAKAAQYGEKAFCSAGQRAVIEKAINTIRKNIETPPPSDNFSDMDDVPF